MHLTISTYEVALSMWGSVTEDCRIGRCGYDECLEDSEYSSRIAYLLQHPSTEISIAVKSGSHVSRSHKHVLS